MARVTVEDCVDKVVSRFELVLLTAKRAREISLGASVVIKQRNDKDEVTALREIASGFLNIDALRHRLACDIQRIPCEDEEDTGMSIMHEAVPSDLNKEPKSAKESVVQQS